LLVRNAQSVIVKVTKDKRRALNAVLVNSTMLPVLVIANYVSTQPTLVAKEETAVASIVPRVGLRKTAVSNVLRVVRVRLALGVKVALKVLPEKETTTMTTMRHNVNSANWVKQRRLKVPLNATFVISGSLVKPKVFVQLAQMDFIKSPKVKMNVLNVHWGNCTSMPKHHVVIVALVRLVAGMAFVRHARLGSFKIPHIQQSAVISVTWQKKYPTKRVPGVNCPHGGPAKWVNIYTTPTTTTPRGNVWLAPTVPIARHSTPCPPSPPYNL
jgi:hypothetical protein